MAVSDTVAPGWLIADVLQIPRATVRYYARQGWITRVRGTDRRPEYEAHEVAVVRHRRLELMRHAEQQAPLDALTSPNVNCA